MPGLDPGIHRADAPDHGQIDGTQPIRGSPAAAGRGMDRRVKPGDDE
jgi:hypothetical protein